MFIVVNLDTWLKHGHQKNLKSSEHIKKKTKQELDPGDASYNVLAAAGLNLGRQFSWTNPSFNSTPGCLLWLNGFFFFFFFWLQLVLPASFVLFSSSVWIASSLKFNTCLLNYRERISYRSVWRFLPPITCKTFFTKLKSNR